MWQRRKVGEKKYCARACSCKPARSLWRLYFSMLKYAINSFLKVTSDWQKKIVFRHFAVNRIHNNKNSLKKLPSRMKMALCAHWYTRIGHQYNRFTIRSIETKNYTCTVQTIMRSPIWFHKMIISSRSLCVYVQIYAFFFSHSFDSLLNQLAFNESS